MKNKLILFAALAVLPAAFAFEVSTPDRAMTPTASLENAAPQKLDKFMVTGSLEQPAARPAQLEKFMVTGSLEDAGQAKTLEKFMVTGSLEDPAGKTTTLEKILVTGSREARPAIKPRHKR